MTISRDAKLMCGITLLTVPTIMYGGVTLLGILTDGTAGLAPSDLELEETQWALWRAGHAHAGVLTILSLVIQVLLDAARLSLSMKWTARVTAPLGGVAISGGFFGVAFISAFQWLLYFGAFSLVVTLLLTGIGLLRNLRPDSSSGEMTAS